jgi:hypothetical protein
MDILQTSSINEAQYNHMHQGVDNIMAKVHQKLK